MQQNTNLNGLQSEGLITGLDRRNKITSWCRGECIGQIVTKFDIDGLPYVGSGCVYYRSRDCSKALILTCAHNFYREITNIHGNKIKKNYIAANFYLKRNATNLGEEYKIKEVIFHPEYFENPTPYGGNDIAIAIIEGHISCGHFGNSATELSHRKNSEIMIRGYPGEKKVILMK